MSRRTVLADVSQKSRMRLSIDTSFKGVNGLGVWVRPGFVTTGCDPASGPVSGGTMLNISGICDALLVTEITDISLYGVKCTDIKLVSCDSSGRCHIQCTTAAVQLSNADFAAVDVLVRTSVSPNARSLVKFTYTLPGRVP